MLVVFACLILFSIDKHTNDMQFAKIWRNTNLANLLVWSYWWPLIIIIAILFGRHWCSICPMELITSLSGKYGWKLKPGKFLKSGWVITIFYAAILIFGVHTFAIHRVPGRMAYYMLALFIVAVTAGFIYEKRAFCTYICPVGHLLGLYSLFSNNGLRVKNQEICESCKTKDCISKGKHYNIIGRSCTSEIYPPKITDNRKCILCTQCVKSCPNNNINLEKKKYLSFFPEKLNLANAEIAFILLLVGFVSYEILSEFSFSTDLIMFFPDKIIQWISIEGQWKGTTKALTLFLVFPMVFVFLFAYIFKSMLKTRFRESLISIAISLLPIIVLMHLFKSLMKMVSRIPYWEIVFKDPLGIANAQMITNGELGLKSGIAEAAKPYLLIFAFLLLFLGIIASVIINKKQKSMKISKNNLLVIPTIIYVSMFLIAIISSIFNF